MQQAYPTQKADGGRHAKPSAPLYMDMQVQSAILKRVAFRDARIKSEGGLRAPSGDADHAGVTVPLSREQNEVPSGLSTCVERALGDDLAPVPHE